MNLGPSGLGYGIHLRTDVTPKLCRRQESDNLILLNRLNRLRHERDVSLTPHADVLVVIV